MLEVSGYAEGAVSFLIRYEDGMYNLGSGFPVHKSEAARYKTHAEATEVCKGLCDVDCIEEKDTNADTIASVLALYDAGELSAVNALDRIKELTCT